MRYSQYFSSNFVATLQSFGSKSDFLIIFWDTENTDIEEISVIPSSDASSSPALAPALVSDISLFILI